MARNISHPTTMDPPSLSVSEKWIKGYSRNYQASTKKSKPRENGIFVELEKISFDKESVTPNNKKHN